MRLSYEAFVLLLPSVTSFQPGGLSVPVAGKWLGQHRALDTQSSLSSTASSPEAIDDSATNGNATLQGPRKKTGKVAIIVCPAQFCVPDDYQVLFDNLRDVPELSNIVGTCMVAPLPRTEWIKVAKKLPTQDFLQANLPVHDTLNWYFDALEIAIADVLSKEGPDVNLCIVGHSIGGWVARAYLGGLSRSSTAVFVLAQERCTSLITLGTPHISPDTALVDQTRGLLREIAESPACSSQALTDRGIDITCVGSSSLSGNFFTTNVEQLVAATSYLPLLGRVGADVLGDGIVPLDLAFMESPARRVQIEKCDLTGVPVRHCHVLPTPWNLLDGYAPSIKLPEDFVSYVSAGVLSQWSKYIR